MTTNTILYRKRILSLSSYLRTSSGADRKLRFDSWKIPPRVPRAYDADLQAPTYLFVRGDDKKPLKETPIPYGIPSMLPVLGPIEAQAVPMPKEAYLPELTPKAEREALLKAWNRFDEARKQLELASLKENKENYLSDHPNGSLEDVAYRVLQVREAEAFLTLSQGRYAADKANTSSKTTTKKKRLSEVALSTEQKWNVLAAELKVLERKQAHASR